jgi:hypothetical protein
MEQEITHYSHSLIKASPKNVSDKLLTEERKKEEE